MSDLNLPAIKEKEREIRRIVRKRQKNAEASGKSPKKGMSSSSNDYIPISERYKQVPRLVLTVTPVVHL
jgi:hypothetical protein